MPSSSAPRWRSGCEIKTEDVVELELNGKKVTGPVWIQAGHPDNSVTVFLGYGRTPRRPRRNRAGFRRLSVAHHRRAMVRHGLQIRKTGDTYKLASTQGYQTMDTPDGDIVRWSAKPPSRNTAKSRSFAKEEEPAPGLTLYKPYHYKEEDYAWGMAIDLNSCVGCNNCMLACQSENNIAVVGKEQIVIGRHMHWIRVDAYYQGDRDNPKAYFQPVPCMQCENAPCEVVCPVGATNHTQRRPERYGLQPLRGHALLLEQLPVQSAAVQLPALPGLGDAAIQDDAQSRRHRAQPRRHGKVHLLRAAHQRAPHRRRARRPQDQDRQHEDELQTACQQSCPAGAIIFGNINDPNSKVSKLKAQARNYSLLGELNTRPRTTYLAEVSNPNPDELRSWKGR